MGEDYYGFSHGHTGWSHDVEVDIADPHHPQDLPFAHDHLKFEHPTHKMTLPDFEFKPMAHHSKQRRHHYYEDETNLIQDPHHSEDFYDPYGLRDYTYDQIYHDYHFHVE